MIEHKMSDEKVENEINEPWNEPTWDCAKKLKETRLEARRLDTELAELVAERQSDARNGWPRDRKPEPKTDARYCFGCSAWGAHVESDCPALGNKK